MADKKKAGRVLLAVVGGLTLLVALYIMAKGLGLVEGLDFGAGAYYYADIPGFENIMPEDAYKAKLPYIVYVLLFLVWGALMYWIWKKLDK